MVRMAFVLLLTPALALAPLRDSAADSVTHHILYCSCYTLDGPACSPPEQTSSLSLQADAHQRAHEQSCKDRFGRYADWHGAWATDFDVTVERYGSNRARFCTGAMALVPGTACGRKCAPGEIPKGLNYSKNATNSSICADDEIPSSLELLPTQRAQAALELARSRLQLADAILAQREATEEYERIGVAASVVKESLENVEKRLQRGTDSRDSTNLDSQVSELLVYAESLAEYINVFQTTPRAQRTPLVYRRVTAEEIFGTSDKTPGSTSPAPQADSRAPDLGHRVAGDKCTVERVDYERYCSCGGRKTGLAIVERPNQTSARHWYENDVLQYYESYDSGALVDRSWRNSDGSEKEFCVWRLTVPSFGQRAPMPQCPDDRPRPIPDPCGLGG